MKKHLYIFFSLILIGGCVNSGPNIELLKSPILNIPVQQIEVHDLTYESTSGQLNAIWSDGYHPLPDNAVNPPFRQATIRQIKHKFVASGAGDKKLRITILHAKILQESYVIDSLAFAGMVSDLAPRGLRCHIEVDFRYEGASTRKMFDFNQEISPSWNSMKTDTKKKRISDCLSDMITKLGQHINEVVTSEQ